MPKDRQCQAASCALQVLIEVVECEARLYKARTRVNDDRGRLRMRQQGRDRSGGPVAFPVGSTEFELKHLVSRCGHSTQPNTERQRPVRYSGRERELLTLFNGHLVAEDNSCKVDGCRRIIVQLVGYTNWAC